MYNKTILVGRLGEKPTVKTTNSGKKVLNASVATWENYYNESEKKWETITEWHKVIVWGDSVDKFSGDKGDNVYVEGSLKSRKWKDNTGVEKVQIEIVGTMKVIKPPKMREEQKEPSQIFEAKVTTSDGDLPF